MGAGHLNSQLRSTPLVFVEDLDLIELDDGDRSHLERSLRVRPGELIIAADGAGRCRPARLGPDVQPDGPIMVTERPTPSLTVGFALVKGDRSDLVVQKLTELGIDTIAPIHSERSVVRWDSERAAKNVTRHRRIVREAAMQSKNLWLPTIEPLTSLADFLAAAPSAALADPEGTVFDSTVITGTAFDSTAFDSNAFDGTAFDSTACEDGVNTIVIGPEGGFSPSELEQRPTVSFPGRILRTETAAITAGVLLAAARQQHQH